jgi:hypothetical protein
VVAAQAEAGAKTNEIPMIVPLPAAWTWTGLS